jgi:hypothetical protein
LLQGFNKIFEATRDRITIYADYYASSFFMFFSVLLLITKQGFIKNKQEVLKRRIFFKLFRGYLRIKRGVRTKKIQFKQRKKKLQPYYKQLLTFVSATGDRFLKYCTITCKKFNNTLSDLISKKNSSLTNMTNELTIPFRIRIADIFAAIDRNYTLL